MLSIVERLRVGVGSVGKVLRKDTWNPNMLKR